DAIVVSFGATHHSLTPPIGDDRLRFLSARAIEAIKWSFRKRAVKFRAIRSKLRLKVVKHRLRQSTRISRSLYHQWRHSRNDGRLNDALILVPRKIADHFAATRGVADVNGVFQIKVRSNRGKIVGIVIEVVTVRYLTRSPVAASIVRYDAITLTKKKQQ